MGYHGRASSIVVSGLPVRRPRGQVLPRGESQPELQPSSVLDFELEAVRKSLLLRLHVAAGSIRVHDIIDN